MDPADRLKRLRYRASHRGTQEADLLISGFCDRHAEGWDDAEILLFEALLEEQDVDIMAWALGTQKVPEKFRGEMMNSLQSLDYIPIRE